jgi:hypothetical protein
MRKIFILPLMAFTLLVHGQEKTVLLVENPIDSYSSIVFLTEGEVRWLDTPVGEIEGISYRVIITRSDIYNSLFIEKITYGTEGCCKNIVSTKEIPVNELFKLFSITGEHAGVKFVEWIDSASFVISIYDRSYNVLVKGDRSVKISQQ